MTRLLVIAGFTALGILAAEAAAYFCIWCRDNFNKTKKKRTMQILFFPDPKLSCRNFFSKNGCTNPVCRLSHDNTSLSQLSLYLNNAKRCVDICVFTVTSRALSDVVVELHERGIVVRVITDQGQVDCSGSQIGKFRKEGIAVRHNYSSYFMHHKFILIDNDLLVSGSFNWTTQAVVGNYENLLVTNEREIAGPYKEEFARLWDEMDPAKQLL